MDRRLAAIFAADVEGYSRLMSQDEVATLEALTSHRALLDGFIAQHRGRIANTAGDSVLAEFPSAVDAIQCALDAQAAIAAANEDLSEDRRLWFRIGVHVGDVMVKGGDLFGDGVNIAARLQALAEPGGICLSASAQEYVRSALSIAVTDLGSQILKNIEAPIRAFAIRPSAATAARLQPEVTRTDRLRTDRPSVTVLPFTNMGGDPDQAYFSDGITEDIITELARFRELLVIARNSSFAFRGKAVDVRDVGKALSADYIVEGSVRRGGDRVRVTAQLINTETGTHVWAERFDRPMDDIFAIQDEIARGVVATVAQRIREETEVVARRRPPQNMRAYDLFLRGQALSDVLTEESQDRARDFYEQARDLDPTFARAYTGLVANYHNRATMSGVGILPSQEPNRIEARRLAEQALVIDPTEPRVQSMAGINFLIWHEFDRAEQHLDLARSMNSNDATIQIIWAWVKSLCGKPEQALQGAELAVRLNPRHPRWYDHYLAQILFLLRRHEEAAAKLEYRLFDDPARHPRDMAWRGAACAHAGRVEEAQRCAAWFIEGMSRVWKGDPKAGPSEYIDWFIYDAHIRRAEDEAHLHEGLCLAGLSA
jgi:TolB-like protein/class 3 adenylate cyclase/tetratricopeptide (TPR) repeat protein